MKNLKLIFAVLSISFFISCSSSEDNSTTPMDIKVSGSIDMTALNSLNSLDATSIVTFSGQAANNFTSEAIPGDKLEYNIASGSATTEIRIIDFRFNIAASNVSFDDWESNFTVTVDTLATPAVAYIDVNEDAAIEDNAVYKFDIDFKVYENGVSNGSIYFTDPKIKIKRRR